VFRASTFFPRRCTGDLARRQNLRAGIRARHSGRAAEADRQRRASAERRSPLSPTRRFSITRRFSFDKLSERLREKAFLNKGIRITIKDEREEPERSHEFYYKGGIAEFVKHLNKNKSTLHDKPIYFEKGRRRALDRSRDSVQRRLRREGLFVRQQHQHGRRRHAPFGISLGVHANDQRLRAVVGSGEELQKLADRRRRARRPGGGDLREAAAAAV
jgi:hypothetical protein